MEPRKTKWFPIFAPVPTPRRMLYYGLAPVVLVDYNSPLIFDRQIKKKRLTTKL